MTTTKYRRPFSGLFLSLVLLAAFNGCREPIPEPGDAEKEPESEPEAVTPASVELYRGETAGGAFESAGGEQWYYFNAAVGCTYALTCLDAGLSADYSGQVQISAYHGDQ